MTALAALAGNTVVTAATTDAWEAARHKFAQLLGRGDPGRAEVAERRLDVTWDQLTVVAPAEQKKLQVVVASQWETRFADLLDEDPAIEAALRALVQEIAAELPAGLVSAASHSVAGGRDVNITASGWGTAAGVIHGNVASPNPTPPGPAAG